MEDAMCYPRDYKIFDDEEQKKTEEARLTQERRAGVSDSLLTQANKRGESTKAEATPAKDIAPAK